MNGEVKNYFKDKINWKSYNYLSYIVTKYEDNGFDIGLAVHIKLDKNGMYGRLFMKDRKSVSADPSLYVAGYNENGIGKDLEYLKQCYSNNGLVFIIEISKASTNSFIIKNILSDIYIKVENKFEKLHSDHDNRLVLVEKS